jgi:hypothetical protein
MGAVRLRGLYAFLEVIVTRRDDLRVLALLAVILYGGAAGPARVEAAAPDSVAASSPGFRWFPPRMVVQGFIYAPNVSYSSETGFGFGGQILRPFRLHPGALRDSSFRLKGRFTLKGQQEVEFRSDLRFGSGYGINTKLAYSSLPYRFYGIGPDTPEEAEEIYRPQEVLAYVEFFRRLTPALRAGLRYEYEQVKLLETESGGLLDTGAVRGGVEDRHVLGLGLVLDWDTRDRPYSPTRGAYYEAFGMVFDDELGSEADLNVYNLDLKNYFPVTADHVFATQFFVYAARGDAPFWRMAALGGREHTRGYRHGRYLDRILVSAQGEYRFGVWRRIGLVVFGGVGDVAAEWRNLELEHMQPTLGTGLRLRTGSVEAVRARLDLAFGRNSTRVYFTLDEAF